MQKIGFSCTTLNGTGKQGVLPKDANGYYEMPVGGLNVFNSAGEYYPYEAAKSLFTDSSALMRRIKTGCLKGEYGHPKMLPGQSMEQFAHRVMTIDEKQTCVHFSEIWLDFNNIKDEGGRPIVAIMAKLTPSGPYAAALEKSLNNPKEDVCFSIRAFTEDNYSRGVKQRNLREIIVWDFVQEPGISNARKYRSPSLESYSEKEFTKADLVNAISTKTNNIATESAILTGTSLFNALGWDFNLKDKPNYTTW